MLSVLIATKPDDADSYYVKLALENYGQEAKLWFTSDMPALQSHTFRLKHKEMRWSAKGLDLDIKEDDLFDVVWRRRPAKPKLNDLVHPLDLKNAMHENMSLYDAFWKTIAPGMFWVNPPSTHPQISCKLTQLKVASRLGFRVPETVVSNNPDDIVQFIKSYSSGDVIYKPMFPVMWTNEDTMRLTYTKPILLEDLPTASVLRLTPGIYQRRIEKAYELRVTCMGHTAIAAKLYSQEHEQGRNDWRSVPATELVMEPYSLPDDIANKCFALMLKFGIVFGCFDFIVTPEGEYVFLEVNEQGQFLWQEQHHPEIKLLDPFVKFLISRSPNFVWNSKEPSVSMPEFAESARIIQAKALETHVHPGLPV